MIPASKEHLAQAPGQKGGGGGEEGNEQPAAGLSVSVPVSVSVSVCVFVSVSVSVPFCASDSLSIPPCSHLSLTLPSLYLSMSLALPRTPLSSLSRTSALLMSTPLILLSLIAYASQFPNPLRHISPSPTPPTHDTCEAWDSIKQCSSRSGSKGEREEKGGGGGDGGRWGLEASCVSTPRVVEIVASDSRFGGGGGGREGGRKGGRGEEGG